MTSSLIYDLTSSEKSLIVTLDNAVQHYDETTARVSMAQEAGLATLHVQTPVPSWEEIDLSAGFDLAKKTAFVLSERNGQSIVLQGLATLPAMSSIVSGTARLPLSLLNEEKKIQILFPSSSLWWQTDSKRTGHRRWPLYRPHSNSCRRPRLERDGENGFFPLERHENRPGRTCSKHSRSFRQGNAVRSVRQAGLDDVRLTGSWTCNSKIKSESALHWAGLKKIEAIFDGQFTTLRSVARLHLVAPHIRPVKTEIQYDFTSTEKSLRADYNSIVAFNSLLAIESSIHWNGKMDLHCQLGKLLGDGQITRRSKRPVQWISRPFGRIQNGRLSIPSDGRKLQLALRR